MRLDKAAYLALASFTAFIIVLIIAFGTYGSNISKDPNFIMFFKWYIFLFVFNLLNIMVTLIFHYIMADIPGQQGLKGFMGDKGLPGENDKCFCTNITEESPDGDSPDGDSTDGDSTDGTSVQTMDINSDIKTRDVTTVDGSPPTRVGTLIYHDDDNDDNTPLIVGQET